MTAYSSDTPMNQYGNSKYGLTLLLLRKKRSRRSSFFLFYKMMQISPPLPSLMMR